MQKLQALTESHTFKRTVAMAIILCSILLGIETFYPEQVALFQGLDFVFTIFFIIEIIVRLGADSGGLKFFNLFSLIKNDNGRYHIHVHERGFWNWFDFIIVIASVISLFSHIFPHPEFLEVARLFRVFRVMRLLEISKELIAVERKIVSIIPTIFSFALLLGVLIFIYGIIGVFLFSHHKYNNADFTSLGHAFLTLFQLMTLDGWSEMMYAASANYSDSWLIKSYFISFVLITAIISFNVFVAVLTSQVHEKVLEDQKLSNSQFIHLEKELSQTEDDIRADFKHVIEELREVRRELEELRRKG
jgi:voltage-gated sodium channel